MSRFQFCISSIFCDRDILSERYESEKNIDQVGVKLWPIWLGCDDDEAKGFSPLPHISHPHLPLCCTSAWKVGLRHFLPPFTVDLDFKSSGGDLACTAL